MKQPLLITFFVLISALRSMAQDVIYTANGNRLDNAKLTSIVDDRITFTVQQSDKVSTHSFQRQNILVAFKKGNFLVIEKLSTDPIQAKNELETFLTTTAWQEKDFLLRAVPLEVIPAKISYENDAIVNYLTNDGKSASISKGELIAILYSDGRHSLIRDASEVAPMMAGLSKTISANTPSSGASPNSVSSTATHTTPTPPEAMKTPDPDPKARQDDGNRAPSEDGPPKVVTPPPAVNKLVLSGAQYQYYRQKALDKVQEFADYLKIIANKSYSDYERNQAIEQAVSLFMPASTMEVTSKSRSGANRYPIRTYLTNLKRLNYKSVSIEWSEIQYLKEFSQAADGNYYGVITGQQTFIGYGPTATYTDVTSKNVRVKLERIIKIEDGVDNVKWGLLLGSIGISAQ